MIYSTEGSTPPGDGVECAVILYRVRKTGRGNRRNATGYALPECRAHCKTRRYSVDAEVCDDGSPWTLNRDGLNRLLRLLALGTCRADSSGGVMVTRPDVLVIRDWEQVGKRPVDRAAFARRMDLLGIRIDALHPAGAPHVTWDPTDHTPERVTRPDRAA